MSSIDQVWFKIEFKTSPLIRQQAKKRSHQRFQSIIPCYPCPPRVYEGSQEIDNGKIGEVGELVGELGTDHVYSQQLALALVRLCRTLHRPPGNTACYTPAQRFGDLRLKAFAAQDKVAVGRLPDFIGQRVINLRPEQGAIGLTPLSLLPPESCVLVVRGNDGVGFSQAVRVAALKKGSNRIFLPSWPLPH